MTLKLADGQQALKMILDSSKAGTFVPVLGFELSCLHQYNKSPVNARKVFGRVSTHIRK